MSKSLRRLAMTAPEGYDNVKESLEDFEKRLKDVSTQRNSKLTAKSKDNLWRIIQINHERSRYIYTQFYKNKSISKELYDWLLRHKLGDKQLIAKWRRAGYEKLCCMQCIQPSEFNRQGTCICRVPRVQLEREAQTKSRDLTFDQCAHCGCKGCASTD